MITHLEPDILEGEVRWALGSITTNKARGDGIPVKPLQFLKDDAVNCSTQYASKFGILNSGHRTGKGQFSLQSQRRAVSNFPSNYSTLALISHASKLMLKIL